MDFKKIVNYLKPVKKPEILPAQPITYRRSFKAAFNNRFVQWLFTSRNTINVDLVTQLETLIQRSRSLSINNQLFRSFISSTEKSVIGSEGFRLQFQIKNPDGTLNEALNEQLQWKWFEFTYKKNLEVTEQLGDIDFDTLVLHTLLVDGEVFIQIVKDKNAPFGVRFKLLDSLCIATDKLQVMTETTNGIFNGVEVDHNYKPVRYWLRTCYDGNYHTGQLYSIPASEVIHIYKSQFINQVRGFSPIVASMDSLKQLDDFGTAELIAAKVASCQGIFYERNSDTPTGDFLNDGEEDAGRFLSQLSPGMAAVTPKGYTVKSFAPNHPNSNFDSFNKSLVKRTSAALGSCYNKINRDYSDVNYSSLKQENIDENAQAKIYQRFLIQNWKNIELEIFLKNYIINSSSDNIRPSDYYKYLKSFRFISRMDPYSDPVKEMTAIEKKLKLGLTSPIAQIQKTGQDVNEVLKDWTKFNILCQENGLHFNYGGDQKQENVFIEDQEDEANDPEKYKEQNVQ